MLMPHRCRATGAIIVSALATRTRALHSATFVPMWQTRPLIPAHLHGFDSDRTGPVRSPPRRAERPVAANRPADTGGAHDDDRRCAGSCRTHQFPAGVRSLGDGVTRCRHAVVLGRAP